MNFSRPIHLATLLYLAVGLSFANAAAFLKLGDIQGESQDSGHRGWIDVLSTDWGITKIDPTTGVSRRGAPLVGDFKFTKELDKSSPKLQEALLTGVVVPVVDFEITQPGDGARAYLVIELKNVVFTSYSMSGIHKDPKTGAEPRPVESFSLNFEEIKVTYTPIAEDGTPGTKVEYSWKIEEGEA